MPDPITPAETFLVKPSGETVAVPSDQAEAALHVGYAPATPKQIADFQTEDSAIKKYGTGTEQAKTFAEAAARALTFGGSTLFQRAAGVEPEAIEARARINPLAELAGTTVGIAAPLALTGGAAAGPEGAGLASEIAGRFTAPGLIQRAGRAVEHAVGESLPGAAGAVYDAEAATNAARIAAKAGAPDAASLAEMATTARSAAGDSGRLAKLVAGSLPITAGSAAEGALYGAGQFTHEKALGNPNANAQMLLADVGLSAAMGGGLGAVFGGGSTAARIALDDAKDAGSRAINHLSARFPDVMARLYGVDAAEDIAILSRPESRTAMARGEKPIDILRREQEARSPLNEPVAPPDLVRPEATAATDAPAQPAPFRAPEKPTQFEMPEEPVLAPIRPAKDSGLFAAKTTDNLNELLRKTEDLSRESSDLYRPAEMRALASKADPVDAQELGQTVLGKLDALTQEMFGNPNIYPSKVFPSKLEQLRIALADDLRDAKPEDVYEAINGFKRSLDKQLLQWNRGAPSPELADTIGLLKGFRKDVRASLEDPTVWGEAGARQSAYNLAVTDDIASKTDAIKRFGETFTTKNGRPEPRFVTDKIQRTLDKWGQSANREDEEVILRFIESKRALHDEIDAASKFAEDARFDRGAAQGLVDRASGAIDAARLNMDVANAAETQKAVNAAKMGEYRVTARRTRLENKRLDRMAKEELAVAKEAYDTTKNEYQESLGRWERATDADKDRLRNDMQSWRDKTARAESEYRDQKASHREAVRDREDQLKSRVAALHGLGGDGDALSMGLGMFRHPILTSMRAVMSPIRAIKTLGTIERITQNITRQIDSDAAAVVRGTTAAPLPKEPSAEILGRRQTTRIVTPDAPHGIAARYAIVDAADVLPSHDSQSFLPNAGYPSDIGARAYPEAAQSDVSSASQSIEPAILLSDTRTATDGPPIVTDGSQKLVLGGNGRAMMVQRAYGEPETGAAYRQALVDKAGRFGFSRSDVEKYATPMLVRVLDDITPASGRSELAGAVKRFAMDAPNASERLRSVANARKLTPDSVASIGSLMEDTNGTMRDAMKSNPTAFRDVLDRSGIVTDGNASEWVKEDGRLTDKAMDRIEGMFLGHVVGSADRLDAATKSLLSKIERTVPSLLNVAAKNAEASEIPAIQGAMDILAAVKANGKKTLADYLADPAVSVMSDGPALTQDAVQMAALLESAKPKELQNRFARWAEDAGRDSGDGLKFGAKPTPDTLRNRLFEGVPTPEMPAQRPSVATKVASAHPVTPETFQANATRIRQLATDPEEMNRVIEKQITNLHSAAPDTSVSMGATSTRAMQFLESKLPVGPANADPLVNAKWTPDAASIARFNRYMEAVEHPTEILKQAASDTLTPEAVEAVKVVYPELYQQMQTALLEQSARMGPMPYRSRLMLSTLLGVGADQMRVQAAANATAYASMAPDGKQAGQGAGKPVPNADKLKLGSRALTGTQRVMAGNATR